MLKTRGAILHQLCDIVHLIVIHTEDEFLISRREMIQIFLITDKCLYRQPMECVVLNNTVLFLWS